MPAMSTKKQNRKKCQKKHLHQLFLQNFKMMYRDSTKNQIKTGAICYFALGTS